MEMQQIVCQDIKELFLASEKNCCIHISLRIEDTAAAMPIRIQVICFFHLKNNLVSQFIFETIRKCLKDK